MACGSPKRAEPSSAAPALQQRDAKTCHTTDRAPTGDWARRLGGGGQTATGAAILGRATGWGRFALRRDGVIAAFLGLWQVGATAGWINPTVFPPPDRIVAAAWTGVTGGALRDDIAISLQRAGIAFAAAVALAVPLGLVMGQIRAVEQALDPILQVFR